MTAKKKRVEVYPPPLPRHIESVKIFLEQGNTLEIAAALAGIPQRHLLYWVKQGRAGEVGYVDFVDMYDKTTANVSNMLWTDVYKRAFEERDFNAIKFYYQNRLKRAEDRFLDRIEAIEDSLVEEEGEGAISEEELARLEAEMLEKIEGAH